MRQRICRDCLRRGVRRRPRHTMHLPRHVRPPFRAVHMRRRRRTRPPQRRCVRRVRGRVHRRPVHYPLPPPPRRGFSRALPVPPWLCRRRLLSCLPHVRGRPHLRWPRDLLALTLPICCSGADLCVCRGLLRPDVRDALHGGVVRSLDALLPTTMQPQQRGVRVPQRAQWAVVRADVFRLHRRVLGRRVLACVPLQRTRHVRARPRHVLLLPRRDERPLVGL